MKKVLIMESFDWDSPHYNVDLEIAEINLEEKNEVIFLTCSGKMPVCIRNPDHKFSECVRCRDHFEQKIALLKDRPKIEQFVYFDKKKYIEIDEDSLADLSSVKKIFYKNFDVGYAVASYIIDLKRNPEPDFKLIRKSFEQLMNLCCEFYEWVAEILQRLKPDECYVMNGRWIYYRAFLRACQANKIDCYTHERGGAVGKYFLFKNTFPHDVSVYSQKYRDVKNSINKGEVESIAKGFYEGKRGGVEKNYKSFITGQSDVFDIGMRSEKINVAIFTSSEFECAAIDKYWDEKPYQNQNVGIVKILSWFSQFDSRFHFIIRCHPNSVGMSSRYYDSIAHSGLDNFTLHLPDSKASTYKIMDSCQKVVTFGSTTGIEACYWQKPSILIGHAFWESLEIAKQCMNHEEVIEAILSDLKPGSKHDAEVYAAALDLMGEKFKFTEMASPFFGYFKNNSLNKSSLGARIKIKIARLIGK